MSFGGGDANKNNVPTRLHSSNHVLTTMWETSRHEMKMKSYRRGRKSREAIPVHASAHLAQVEFERGEEKEKKIQYVAVK